MFKTCVRHALAGMAMLVLAGAARADGFSPAQTPCLFAHLSRSERAGKMDCAGRHHEAAHRLGAASIVEANLRSLSGSGQVAPTTRRLNQK